MQRGSQGRLLQEQLRHHPHLSLLQVQLPRQLLCNRHPVLGLPQERLHCRRLHHQERQGRRAQDQEHQSDQDQQATLLNPDVAKRPCWRRCAECRIRSTTCATSERRGRGRDQGQHSEGDTQDDDPGQTLDGHVGIGTLDRGQERPPCDRADRGRSRERSPVRVPPKTPPMPPPTRSVRSTSTGRDESG